MLFAGCSYKGHCFMQERLNLREARLQGKLVEYEQMKFEKRKKSLKGRILGTNDDEAPIKLKIGGQWQLQDLNGRLFGS